MVSENYCFGLIETVYWQ